MSDIVSSKHSSIKLCTICRNPRDNKGSGSYCNSCYSAYRRQRRKDGIECPSFEETRDRNLRSNYGITLEEYDLMFFQQAGLCALCKRPETVIDFYTKKPKALGVDHNHKTGDVRGLLCTTCNHILGHIEKDRSRVRKSLKYLEKHDS